MKNYKYAIGLIALLLTIESFGQEIKVFNDKFRDGTAEYEYYVNENYDIVYDGFFHYNGAKYTVDGHYKTNLPDGEWTITATNKVFSNSQTKIQSNTLVKGSYSNGQLNGLWQYQNAFALEDWETGGFRKGDNIDSDISEASFSNNFFVGDISFRRNFQKISITGSFDNQGIVDETWTYTKDNEEDVIKYNKGVAYWRLVRNLPTGEKALLVDSTVFVNAFWANYDSTSNVSIVNGNVYYPQKVKLDAKKRVKESAIDLTNSTLNRNRRTYDNPAISIWQNVSVDVYNSYSASNPLYYGVRDSNSPLAYEVLIKQCSYSTSNDKFISNSECLEKLRELKN